MRKSVTDKLKNMGACSEAIKWAESQPSIASAWDNCPRGDWMLWLLGKLSGPPESQSRKKLVLAACQCARLALRHVPKGETRPLKAIQTAESWAKIKPGVTLADVRAAAAAAYADYAAAAAAASAAYADYADYAASYAASYAADDAAAADDADDARTRTHKLCANRVRKLYPNAPRITLIAQVRE